MSLLFKFLLAYRLYNCFFGMENKPNLTSWFGDFYQKFEAVCFEDDVWQEGLKYVEDQVQIVGANVMQFVCEIVPQSSSVGNAVCDSLVTNSIDKVYKMSKDGVCEGFSEKDPCNEINFLGTNSRETYNVVEHDLLDNLTMSVGNSSQAKQHDLELSDKITNEDEDPSTPLLSLAADDLIASIVVLPAVSSSNSTFLADSFDTEGLDITLSGDDSSTGLMRKDVPMNENSLGESSHVTKFDASCILIDGSDFTDISSVSTEAGRSKSFKNKFGASFICKRSRRPDCGLQPDTKLIREKGVGEAVATSSITSTLNHEYYDSEWEII